jgi:hypothetical protein
MLQTMRKPCPQRITDDALVTSIDRLIQVLDADVSGHEREWAERMAHALARIEEGLRRHGAVDRFPDGLLAEVEDTTPTLARKVDELCREHGDLLEQCLALQEEVRLLVEAFAPAAEASRERDAWPKQTGSGMAPAVGAIREQAEPFLASLRQNNAAETKLLQESVNTDLGGGD